MAVEQTDAAGDTMPPAPLPGWWTPRVRDISFILGVAATLVLVLVIHGFWWGESQPMVQVIVDAGGIQCLHNEGLGALAANCSSIGQPLGFTFLLGMPEVMLGWLISYIPGVDAWTAHQVLNALLDAIALASGYLLLRRWDVIRPFALVAAATYLTSPSILGLNGFGYTFNGFTFLPLYCLLFLISLDAFTARRTVRAAAILTPTIWLMVFTDGYSYATGLLLIGITGLSWAWRDPRPVGRAKVYAAITFVLANATGYAAYREYITSSASSGSSLGQFRYYAMDVATMFIPLRRMFWPAHVGYTPPSLTNLYGDGGNNLFNYMGIVMMAVVAWAVLSRQLRKRAVQQRREIVPLFLGSLVALYLSFGPGLKFYSQVDPNVPVGNVPSSATRFPLPITGFLDVNVPPFNDMRSDWRWSIPFRLVLVFGSAYVLSLLWHRRHRVIAATLMILAVVDVAPAPNLQIHINSHNAAMLRNMKRQLLSEFDQLTNRGERVLMAPSFNDFLAITLGPFADVKTDNVGGDKNHAASSASWPLVVRAAVSGIYKKDGSGDRIDAVLHGSADVFVISYADLHLGAQVWPYLNPKVAELHTIVAQVASDPRFVVHDGTWMATVRLKT